MQVKNNKEKKTNAQSILEEVTQYLTNLVPVTTPKT